MLRFNNLPIAIKVFLAPALLIAALLATGVLAVTAFNGQIAATEQLDGKVFEPLRRALVVRDQATLIHAQLFALMSAVANETDTAKRDADARALTGEVERFTREFAAYVAILGEQPTTKDLAGKLSADFAQYLDAGNQAVELGKMDASYGALMMGETNKKFTTLRAEFDELAAVLDGSRKTAVSAQMTELTAASRRLAGIVGGFAIASFLATFWIGRGIARPTVRLTEAMTRIAGGELGCQVPDRDRTDEIGRVAAAVEIFKENARAKKTLEAEQRASEARRASERRQQVESFVSSFESSVGGIVESVAAAADGMHGMAEDMSTYVQGTSGKTESMATAANATQDGVQIVAAATEELSSSIQQISEQVTQSKTVARDAVAEAGNAGTAVKALNEAAQRIGEVMDLIRGIASQTNLLALNATIEAARAGESGRGFAVVAQEVKTLAGETSRATSEIQGQIEAIQSTTTEVVASIDRIAGTIESMNVISTAIGSAIEQQQSATGEIAQNASRAAAGATELASNVGIVRESSTKAGESAHEVVVSADRLSQQAAELRREVQRFIEQVQTAA